MSQPFQGAMQPDGKAQLKTHVVWCDAEDHEPVYIVGKYYGPLIGYVDVHASVSDGIAMW